MTLDLTAPLCCTIVCPSVCYTAYRVVLIWAEVRVRTKPETERPQPLPPVVRVGSLWALLLLSVSAAGAAGYAIGRHRDPASVVEEGPGKCTPRTCKPPKKCVDNICTDTADQARPPTSALDDRLASLPDQPYSPVDPPDGLN